MSDDKYWYQLEPNGHVWRSVDGHLDIFGLDIGSHNGPICVNCGYSFCHHCKHGKPVPPCRKPVTEPPTPVASA